jgi:chorismate synthase
MAGNTFGNIFKLSSFGESHGKALGGVIDGCPAGVDLDLDFINKELNRRRTWSIRNCYSTKRR